MDKIRVGLIRCDMHGMYYGALMARHDPMRLQAPMADRSEATYTWQTGGAHFYFYTHYSDPTRMTVPSLHDFEITRVWDESPEAAEVFATVFETRPGVCQTFDEVSDDVDLVFVADCNYDGSDHLELATPGIEKGVPTFIDKPLACDLKDAQAIVDLAQRHEVPVLSLSILRTLPQARLFADRFPEVGEVAFVSIKGGGPSLAGQIHAISLAQNFFGPGVASVECMGENPLGFIHLNYPDKPGFPPCGVMLNADTGATYHCAFYASAFGRLGAIHSSDLGDFEFPHGAFEILKKVKQMVETGKPPVPYGEMLENIAVATAARQAHRTGRRVSLKEAGFDIEAHGRAGKDTEGGG